MGKIVVKNIRVSLLKYLIPCVFICLLGCESIEGIVEYIYDWYCDRKLNYTEFYEFQDELRQVSPYLTLIQMSKYLLMPVWSAICFWFTFWYFYRRELKAPIETLQDAADRILGDDLDFKVESNCTNELGQLCVSFEEMRKNLYESNYELWKSLEERKRLNSAFSHDLRTPITVLKGYAELVRTFDGRLSHEKQAEILKKMSDQTSRLEHYTEKMNSVQKLEDIIPDIGEESFTEIVNSLNETGSIVCEDVDFVFSAEKNTDVTLYIDREIVMQVFENLVSNAVRYTNGRIECRTGIDDDKLFITVEDNGAGFSEDALRKAWKPFYRDDKEMNNEHFGLGLYICRLLCRKCGGDIDLKNSDSGGGMVTATFSLKNLESR